ncbi:hypothetical protein ACLMJK_000523 [Lecanora helva]
MAGPDPTASAFPKRPPPLISKYEYFIAGIYVTVYGLKELIPATTQGRKVACIWLLHPRLQTHKCMEPLAASIIHEWNEKVLKSTHDRRDKVGLIAASFDQRNHGSRGVDPMANEPWTKGNKNHARDMFSIYHGTALDVSSILPLLPAYIFGPQPTVSVNEAFWTISHNFVLGVSLGGHAAWHCLMHEPRITAAIIIVGCPDFTRLMADRAMYSRLDSWVAADGLGPGARFLGSAHFPSGLMDAVQQADPVGMMLGEPAMRTALLNVNTLYGAGTNQAMRDVMVQKMRKYFGGKSILNLSGKADKMVPYRCSETFILWLKEALNPDGPFAFGGKNMREKLRPEDRSRFTLKEVIGFRGFFADGGLKLRDIQYEGVGHEVTPKMMREVHKFVAEELDKVQKGLKDKREAEFKAEMTKLEADIGETWVDRLPGGKM